MLAILTELQDRLHNAAMAGVQILSEDFRLKKTVEQFGAAAASSPVLSKIYAAVKALPDAKENQASQLLDAITLVDAVVCTQADTKMDGAIETPRLYGRGALCQHKYSALQPLHMALTSVGSGRYDVVHAAYREKQPVLHDFRLQGELVGALADSYADMAELVSRILKEDGKAAVPMLKCGFDPMGKKDMVRRVQVMEQIAGAEENDWYLEMLDKEGAPPVRSALLIALRHDQKNVEKLFDFAAAEKGNAKKAAQYALACMQTPEAEAYICKLLSKKTDTTREIAAASTFSLVADTVADELMEGIKNLLEQKEPDESDLKKLFYLPVLRNKCTEKTMQFYAFAALHSEEIQRKGEKWTQYMARYNQGYDDAATMIGTFFSDSVCFTCSPALCAFALQQWKERPCVVNAQAAASAALLTKSPAAAYEEIVGAYAGDLTKIPNGQWKKEGWNLFWCAFTPITFDQQARSYTFRIDDRQSSDFLLPEKTYLLDGFDTRWIDLLCNPLVVRDLRGTTSIDTWSVIHDTADMQREEIVQKVCAYLLSQIRSKDCSWEWIEELRKCGWKEFRGLFKYLGRAGDDYYRSYFYKMLSELMTSTEAGEELLEVAAELRAKKVAKWDYRRRPVDEMEKDGKFLLSGGTFAELEF